MSRLLGMILVVGGLLRVVFLYTTRETGLMIVDEQHYYSLALNLLNGYGFAWEPGKLTSLRPPLYPTLIALLWKLNGGESVLLIRSVQIGLNLMNVYLLYRLGTLLFSPRIALLAAASFCFYPSFIAFNFFLLTEVLFTFLLTCVLLGSVALTRRRSIWIALTTGAGLGFASLTRSVLWPFPILLCPLVFWNTTGNKPQRLWAALALLLGYTLVIAPWAIRNTQLQGVFTIVDTMGGIVLRMGNYEYTDNNRAWDPATLFGERSIYQELYLEHAGASSWTEGQKEKWALKKTLHYILHHPRVTLQRATIKFANFWGLERVVIAGWQQKLYRPPLWFAILGVFVISLSYMITMLLACVGERLASPSDRRDRVLLLLVVSFITGMHTVAFGHERYHLPLIPILLLYSSAAIVQKSWRRLYEREIQTLIPVVACFILLLIWGREVFLIDNDRIKALLSSFLG